MWNEYEIELNELKKDFEKVGEENENDMIVMYEKIKK